MTSFVAVIGLLLVVLVVLVVAVLAYAATRPDAFRVQRTAHIQAPPERIFPFINDLHQWVSWSPWEKIDPALKREYSGAASGKGAVYAWEGDSKVGAGRMEITESTQPSRIVFKLDFFKPFEGHNTTEFTLTPAGGATTATTVTWAMFGPSPFVSKLMGVFINMDRMIGAQFERGLANLKAVSET